MDSVKKRYFYTLGSSVINLIVGLVTAGIVPRSLGPKMYGSFSFLQSTFQNIINFLEMKTGDAFFTYNAKQKNSLAIIKWYLKFSLLLLVSLAIITTISIFTGFHTNVWPDQQITLIILGSVLGILVWFKSIVFRYGDSKGVTVVIQKLNIFFIVIFTAILVLMYFAHQINIYSYFIYLIVTTSIYIIILVVIYIKYSVGINRNQHTSKVEKPLIQYFTRYSLPLLTLSFFSFIQLFFDRWYLQIIGGSVDQAFFNIGWRFAGFCFILTSSMTPIFFREVAAAHSENNTSKMRDIYVKYLPLFYFLSSIIVIFFVTKIDLIIKVFLGNDFIGALFPMIVISFYPIHQTYGQFNGAVLLATERTKLVRNIGIISSIFGILLTVILLAPSSGKILSGFHLGATGLAIKFILVQLIITNVQMVYNARFLKIKAINFFLHQLVSILALIIIVVLTGKAASIFFPGDILLDQILNLLTHGALYVISVGLFIYNFPWFIGSSKEEIELILQRVVLIIRKRSNKTS